MIALRMENVGLILLVAVIRDLAEKTVQIIYVRRHVLFQTEIAQMKAVFVNLAIWEMTAVLKCVLTTVLGMENVIFKLENVFAKTVLEKKIVSKV